MHKEFYQLLTAHSKPPKRVLHVGANAGQEALFYEEIGVEAWHVEAIPDVYNQLEQTCSSLRSQYPICACLSNKEGLEIEFKIASNAGLSSSFLELGRHKNAHPEVSYTGSVTLVTKTINGLIVEGLVPSDIDFLVLDVQGAEKLILEGADLLLTSNCLRGCQIETSVVPLYEGGATYLEIGGLLAKYNFHLMKVEFNRMGWSDALFCKPYWPEQLTSADLEVISILRPKPSPAPLIRVGGLEDGAYLIPDDLEGVKACYSPGVNNRKEFEDELLDVFGIDAHMCDFTSDPERFKTPLKSGQTFKKKWLDIENNHDSISLADWILEMNPSESDDLMLQMDIEGAEYRTLLATSDAVLQRFRIIVLELHGLTACNSSSTFNREIGPLLNKLGRHFSCVHIHPNNCSSEFIITGTELNLASIIEVTFLRKDRWNKADSTDLHPPMLPHPKDIVCNVPDQPPIFFNENWLNNGLRSSESEIKFLSDMLDYKNRIELRLSDTTRMLHRIAVHAASMIQCESHAQPSGDDFVREVACGKKYYLSSSYANSPASGLLEDKEPFFFHTGPGRNQYITIDLGGVHRLNELHVINRTDMCQERARFLCYCLHNAARPTLESGLPLNSQDEILSGSPQGILTNLNGKAARYLTLFSPDYTMLHLSSVKIYGAPVDSAAH